MYYNSTPIEVEDGIKAKSRRGAIGEEWWSQKWVSILESISLSNRLQRGRNYARRGQVMDFKLRSGKVEAKVQGSVSRPYSIEIIIKPFNSEGWNRIIKKLSKEAFFAAKLLAGEVPRDIEDIFDAVGLSLFPQSSKDIETYCSCPDTANPCKHIAAVHYILAEEFDVNPFMLFKLRGMTKKEIILALRKERTAHATQMDTMESLETSEKETKEKKKKDSISLPIKGFWDAPSLGSFSVMIKKPKIPLNVIKKRGIPNFWDNKNEFYKIMGKIYNHISNCALKKAFTDEEEIQSRKPIHDKKKTLKTSKKVLEEPILRELFNKQTGKNAIWGGKITKGYLKWKKQFLGLKSQNV